MIIEDNTPIAEPKHAETAQQQRHISIGLPASATTDGHCFPLTPESAMMLVERGFNVLVESKAAAGIHYTDAQYAAGGVNIVSRREALDADIVVCLNPLESTDLTLMKRGSILLTLLNAPQLTRGYVKSLLDKRISTVALDLIKNNAGQAPFADILMEIEGKAAITVASYMLADPIGGKGILLGGVSGVVPCEVLVIGSDVGARTAAAAALSMEATVRMLDNDIYGLREAKRALGPGVATSALHPHVLQNSLRSADVVIGSRLPYAYSIDSQTASLMKKQAVVIGLADTGKALFPSLPRTSIAKALSSQEPKQWGSRVCYSNPGNAVPRTAAMAISNTLFDLLQQIAPQESSVSTMHLIDGLRNAVVTFMGKPVNAAIAAIAGERPMDINLLFTCY